MKKKIITYQIALLSMVLICSIGLGCSRVKTHQYPVGSLESLYNEPMTSNDVWHAGAVINEIDRIALSNLTEKEKRALIEKQKSLFTSQWWARGEWEKALLFVEMSDQVKSRDAWVECIIPASNRGDERCVVPMKNILESRDDLDATQRYFLYEGIARIGGKNEQEYLQQEYLKVQSYNERFSLAFNLSKMGDKTGVATLIEAYEKRSDNKFVQDSILRILRELYGTNYGDDINIWKENVLGRKGVNLK